MELAEAIEVVREFQAWRRGGDQPMPYPQTTGEALDALCYHAERMEAELAVWKREAKLMEAELQKFDQAAIDWWCEYQDLKTKAADDRAEHEETTSGARMLADAYSAERALADRLAETLANVQGDYATTGAIMTQEVAQSLAAWEEARDKA